jgi:hypothetical protein
MAEKAKMGKNLSAKKQPKKNIVIANEYIKIVSLH